jgi:hypothetical protein
MADNLMALQQGLWGHVPGAVGESNRLRQPPFGRRQVYKVGNKSLMFVLAYQKSLFKIIWHSYPAIKLLVINDLA